MERNSFMKHINRCMIAKEVVIKTMLLNFF